MVIDEDGMYALGMMNKTLRIGESTYLEWLRFILFSFYIINLMVV